MLRIAVQSKGRLNEDSMKELEEVGVKLSVGKRQLLTRSSNFPSEILFLRDDDIPKTVADGIADVAHQRVHRGAFVAQMPRQGREHQHRQRHEDESSADALEEPGQEQGAVVDVQVHLRIERHRERGYAEACGQHHPGIEALGQV